MWSGFKTSFIAVVTLLSPFTHAIETVERTALTIGNSIPITNGTLTTCQPQKFVYTRPNAPYLSVHFAHFSLVQGDLVTISTVNGSEVHSVTPPPGISTFSSSRIQGPTVVITFSPIGCLTMDLPTDFGWTIDALEYTFSQSVTKQDVCGAANQNRPAVCFKGTNNITTDAQVYTSSMAIARLMRSTSTRDNERGKQLSCTGWLLGSQGHFMTNHHCIKNADEANRTNFEFMVQSPQCDDSCHAFGDCRNYGTIESYGADFILANETLDYAIVQLRRHSCVLNGKYGFLQLRRTAPVAGELMYMVQHPKGGAKAITYTEDDDKVVGTTKPAQVAAVNDENNLGNFWTSYYADTEEGSSGSPVLSQVSHTVIALHSNGACKNSGAPSHLIVQDLERNGIQLPLDAFV